MDWGNVKSIYETPAQSLIDSWKVLEGAKVLEAEEQLLRSKDDTTRVAFFEILNDFFNGFVDSINRMAEQAAVDKEKIEKSIKKAKETLEKVEKVCTKAGEIFSALPSSAPSYATVSEQVKQLQESRDKARQLERSMESKTASADAVATAAEITTISEQMTATLREITLEIEKQPVVTSEPAATTILELAMNDSSSSEASSSSEEEPPDIALEASAVRVGLSLSIRRSMTQRQTTAGGTTVRSSMASATLNSSLNSSQSKRTRPLPRHNYQLRDSPLAK